MAMNALVVTSRPDTAVAWSALLQQRGIVAIVCSTSVDATWAMETHPVGIALLDWQPETTPKLLAELFRSHRDVRTFVVDEAVANTNVLGAIVEAHPLAL